MEPVLAVEILGQDVPPLGFVAAAVAFLFLAGLSVNGSTGNRVGHGMKYRCKRCGVEFQPEKIELLASGDTKHWIDERCPHCGWELDWGSPNKPGGASGHW